MLTESELSALAALLQTHTAASRLAHGELMAALRLIDERGYLKQPAAD